MQTPPPPPTIVASTIPQDHEFNKLESTLPFTST